VHEVTAAKDTMARLRYQLRERALAQSGLAGRHAAERAGGKRRGRRTLRGACDGFRMGDGDGVQAHNGVQEAVLAAARWRVVHHIRQAAHLLRVRTTQHAASPSESSASHAGSNNMMKQGTITLP
jgi:hypothetical protein